MQQLSGQDALFLHTENGVLPQHMLSINIYNPATACNGKVTYADIVAHPKQRLSRSAFLRQRLVRVPLDQPYWLEAAGYAVESHIQHLAVPQQADWRALCKLMGQLHSEPLNKAQPMWEAYFIEGLDGLAGVPEGSFALVLKVHRAALNGVGGAELNNALHDLTPVPMDRPQLSSLRVDRQPSGLELIGRACGNSLLRLGKLSGVATQTVPALQRIRAGAQFVTGFNAGPLLAGVGLVHTITTTPAAEEGEFALAFTACPTLLPYPQHYQQCLQTAFDELVVATRQGARQAA